MRNGSHARVLAAALTTVLVWSGTLSSTAEAGPASPGSDPWELVPRDQVAEVFEILGLNGFFVALFIGSACLFRRAARNQPAAAAGP
jgi:hypothetical protein